jgi:hypothetical protein
MKWIKVVTCPIYTLYNIGYNIIYCCFCVEVLDPSDPSNAERLKEIREIRRKREEGSLEEEKNPYRNIFP